MTRVTGSCPIESGAVLGIDVGYSSKKRSTGLCILHWGPHTLGFRFERTKTPEFARRQAIRELVGGMSLLGAAIDGPLALDLREVQNYRAAEAVLSQGVMQKRGKPGSTNSPTGRQLHQHANQLARLVLEETNIGPSRHFQAIHERCIVEAFPNIFLAAGIPEEQLPRLKRDASDKFWDALTNEGRRLQDLISSLLPGRSFEPGSEIAKVTHHEDRASLICALTALSVISEAHVGIGDPEQGYITLPPKSWWGSTPGFAPWLEPLLYRNIAIVRSRNRHPQHGNAQMVSHDDEWLAGD